MKNNFLTITLIFTLLLVSCKNNPSLDFEITGLNKNLSEKVRARLELKRSEITDLTTNDVKEFYQSIPDEILQELKLQGYFQSTVKSSKEIVFENDKYSKSYKVNLSSPLLIDSIDIQVLGEGKNDTKFMEKIREFPLKKGDVFQTESYNRAKQFIFDLTDKNGYVKAFWINKRVYIDIKKGSANLILYINTGKKYHFGKTNFIVKVLSPTFLSKFLPYKKGSVYRSKSLYSLQKNFANNNLFENVIIKPQIPPADSSNREIPIEVELKLRKSKQYNIGGGFGTDTGPRASAGVQLNYLTPYAHSFKSNIQVSQIQNEFEAHYLIPGKNPITDLYDFTGSARTLDFDNNESWLGQIGLGYTTSFRNWRHSIKINFQQEHYKLQNMQRENSSLLIPCFTLSHTNVDDPIKPSQGHSINISIQGAIKYFLATDDFIQAHIDAKYMRHILNKTQVILRASLGYTAIDEITNLPLSLQFYVGGSQTVRGFSYNSIGPGHNLIVGSVEFRQLIYKDYYVSMFYDAGNVGNDLLKKLNQGVGLGIGVRTSIGSLELTYAKAITQPGAPGKIQFNMGIF